jgi:hypothetical protein
MGVPIQAILGAKNLISVIQSIKAGLPEQILPSGFLASSQKIEGDYGTYRKVEGQRATARLAMYGAPSKLRELKGLSEVPVKLVHTIESSFIKPLAMQNLLKLDDDVKQEKGKQEVAREQKDFAQLFQNLRVAAVFSILANGKIWFDANGELLNSSQGAVVTIDYGIPAANQAQLNAMGTGAIISASWATAGTNIAAQINALKEAAVTKTGYPITDVFYGKNVLTYILSNTLLQAYMQHNQKFTDSLRTDGIIPDGFLGLRWHPFNWAFFARNSANPGAVISNENILKFLSTATASTATYLPNDDTCVFTPEPEPDWWDMLEGSYLVPNDIGVAKDAMEALDDMETVYGMFNYAVVSTDPPTCKMVGGDTFLPVLKVPKAVYQANVHFA